MFYADCEYMCFSVCAEVLSGMRDLVSGIIKCHMTYMYTLTIGAENEYKRYIKYFAVRII